MAIELDKIAKQAVGLWANLKLFQKLAIVGGALLVLAVTGFLALSPPPERWSVLSHELSAEEAGQVVEQLRATNARYRIGTNGVIEVPEASVYETRMTLASSGIPRSGFGFDAFIDKKGFGRTTFEEKMTYQRALEGELARSIGTIDAVARARVHLSMKEDTLYASKEEPSTASVVLELRPGHELTPKQVRGIGNLVSSAVKGLTLERVSIIDERGEELTGRDDEGTADLQKTTERDVRKRVSELLEPVVGRGHYVVAVTAELDTTQTDTTKIIYDDKPVARSSVMTEERSGAALGGAGAGGVAGARANLPGATPAVDPAQPQQPLASAVVDATKDGSEKKSATINNEISETRSRSIGPKVRLGRLHVAVLVDAASLEPRPVIPSAPTTTIAATSTSTPTPIPAKTSSSTMLAGLTTKDLPSIHALVGTAAGIDLARGDRIEVRSIPFASSRETTAPVATAPSPLEQLLKQPKVLAIGAGALVAVIVLAVLVAVVVRRRKKKAAEAKEPELVATQVLPLTAAQMESALETGKLPEPAATTPLALPPLTPRDRAIEAVRADTARAARVLAAWLTQPVEEPVRAGDEK